MGIERLTMSTNDKARLFGNKFSQGADVMGQGTEDYKGDVARLQSFIGAIAIADLVKSTLGPMGMDKILLSTQGKEMKVTNDGATILKSVVVDNPAANVLINMGLDMMTGTVGDMAELGIMESFRSKEQSLLSAAEAAEMIIRVDQIVKSAPRQRQ